MRNSKCAELRFGRGDIDFSRIHIGDKLWKTDDPELNRRLRRSFEGDALKFQRPVEIEAHGIAGGSLTLIVRDEPGHVVQLDSAKPLAKAEKQPLTTDRLREQLGRLGGTPFKLGDLKNHLRGEVLLPVSELNRLRRKAVAELEKLRARPKRWTLNSGLGSGVSALGKKRAFVHSRPQRPDTRPNAHRPRPHLVATRSRVEMRCGNHLL